MKKKIIQILLAFLFAIPVMSQTVTIVDVSDALPGDVSVDLDIEGFTDAGAVTLNINFDDNLLTYQNGQHIPHVNGTFLISESNGVLTVGWLTDDFYNGTSLNGDFVTLKFSYSGGFDALLEFDGICEIEHYEVAYSYNLTDNPGMFINGTISPDLSTLDGEASLGTNYAVAGADVSIPLTIADLGGFAGEVSAIILKVGFDSNKLSFLSLTNNSLGLSAVASDGILTIEKFNLSPQLNEFPYVVTINFNYNGGGVAAVEFMPGSVFNDAEGVTLVTLFEGGWVDVDLTDAAKLTIAKVSSPEGYWEDNPFPPYGQQFVPQPVLVPVTADDFAEIEVGSIILKIAYNSELLDYTGFLNGPLGLGWTVTQTDGHLEFERIGQNGIALPDGTLLFTLKFNYYYDVADITFEPGTIISNLEGTPVPVNLENGYVASFITVNAKVYLQGAWNGTNMNTALLNSGVIPLVQPYSVAPWSYPGNEEVAAIPDDVVDWILVELRTGTDAASLVGQRAGFLLNDGRIVDLDGESLLALSSIFPGDYYIVVKHRNHLAIMSSTAVPLEQNTVLYDFTNAQSKSHFDPLIGTIQNKDLNSDGNFWGLLGGDGDADGNVFPSDLYLHYVNQANLQNGYYSADWDMDTNVFPSDLFYIYSPNANLRTHVPE